MTLYDLSLTLTKDLPTWPGDPPLRLEKISSIAEGEHFNVTQLSSSVHIGTHVDAPAHFLEDGTTVDQIRLELMVGPAEVVAVSGQQAIHSQDLRDAGIQEGKKRVLLQTSNSKFWADRENNFQEDFLALAPDAAEYLVACGVEVIGVDYLSVASFPDQVPTHRILLEAGILIIEGLNLAGIQPGPYTLLCLPLKIGGADGAPARVLLQD
ncbi:MAG: cyclase family protein [Anaerolineales bacterium]